MADEDASYAKGSGGKPRTLEALEGTGERRFSPSIGRNKDVVRDALLSILPMQGNVLEIGSGTGEHGIHVTESAPDMRWTFTEYNEDAWPSIRAWMAHAERPGLSGPLKLDAAAFNWGEAIEATRYDGVFSANVIHIAPFEVCTGLLAGAARLLKPAGRLVIYGPFGRDGVLSQGNANFDADLKRRDVSWGVRDLERDVVPLAEKNGLRLVEIIEMPKANLTVAFERF